MRSTIKTKKGFSEFEKEEYLLRAAQDYAPHCDAFAHKTKKGGWVFGYTNDVGPGENHHLPDGLVESLMRTDRPRKNNTTR